MKLLKAVDESTKVWVGALIRELWSFRGLGVTLLGTMVEAG